MAVALAIDAALERELAGFVAAEAALLDAGRFDEWLALFTEDGRYWVPLQGARQADPHSHNSLAYEDHLLLALRIARLKNPRAHSQHPPSRCQHVLQQSVVEAVDADAPVGGADDHPHPHRHDRVEVKSAAASASAAQGEVAVRTPFLYVEARGDEQLILAGTCRHRLAREGGGWKIRLKRIDLLDAERPLPAIQLFI